jgi:tetratricopeptide (TPR) repeat protein
MMNRRIAVWTLSLALMTDVSGRAASEPGSIAVELAAAKALLAAHKFPEARAALEKVLLRAPNDPEANCEVALFACDDQEWEKALRHADIAVRADPKNARYQYAWGAANGIAALKGGVFSKLGHAKKCLAAYQRAAELEPGNLQYHWTLLNFYQAAPGFAGGDPELALAEAAKIKRLNLDSGHQALVQVYVSQKKFDLAFAECDDALRQKPNDFAAHYNLGRLALMAKLRLDDALGAFRQCLTLPAPSGDPAHQRADIHWRIGSVWEAKKRTDNARAEYALALKEDSGFQPAKRALEKLAQAH